MIDAMLVTHEFRALVLFRFAMLPFSVKNYGLGALPSVRLYSFAVTCVLGDFPFTVAFAYAGRMSHAISSAHTSSCLDRCYDEIIHFWIFVATQDPCNRWRKWQRDARVRWVGEVPYY